MAVNNIFHLHSIDGELVVESEKLEKIVDRKSVAIQDEKAGFSIKSKHYSKMDDFIASLDEQFCSLNITEAVKDKFFKLSAELVKSCEEFYSEIFDDKCEPNCVDAIVEGTQYVVEQLKLRNSKPKRQRIVKKKDNYVPPEETALGKRWKTTYSTERGIPDHRLAQSTYHMISIEKTLRSIFSNKKFAEMYENFNQNPSHICTRGRYEDFCCGDVYRKLHAQLPRNTIQLQISFDEFEPCDALKSKSGLHKLLGIYMEIRNVPEFYRSKMENMFLVALVKVTDLKETDDTIDTVYTNIVDEIRWLEEKGIDGVSFHSNDNLKATLINITADNLGANDVFGFVKCFRAQYFCRICVSNQEECKKSVKEDPSKIRDMSNYAQLINKADRRNGRYIDSKGVVKYCVFNDLNYFNIFQNFSVDVMHDMYEGIIPFFIHLLLNHMIDRRIATVSLIQRKIRIFMAKLQTISNQIR